MVVAADRKQSRVIMRYCLGLLEATPMLRELIVHKTRERIDLKGSVTIEVHTASMKTTRGYSASSPHLLDELAFWPTDEYSRRTRSRSGYCATSRTEQHSRLDAAMRQHPPMPAKVNCGMPTAHYGKEDSPVLVWQAPTRTMNRRIPQRIIDEATEADPASASAEYGAQFRTDVESFVLREAVEACITSKVVERVPEPINTYWGFCDPSGGSSDEMTLAISHYDYPKQTVVHRCPAMVQTTFLARDCRQGIRHYFKALSRLDSGGGPLCWRMAKRTVQ